jgi:HAD superfamily hydrolase (TIGR01450 family)
VTWLLDLDGVVWRGVKPIDGSASAIAMLQSAGQQIGFVTNNSTAVFDQMAKLAAMGIEAAPDDLVNGPDALATQLTSGWTVLCVSVNGIRGPLEAKGINVVMVDDVRGSTPPRVDAVAVAIRPENDMRALNLAIRAVLQCGRLFAPSADPLYPVDDGFDIGGGSLTHAVAYATGVEPVFTGKPFLPMTETVKARFDQIEYVVGDQTKSDGGLAKDLAVPFILVQSGVTAPNGRMDRADVPVAHEFPDLATAVKALL